MIYIYIYIYYNIIYNIINTNICNYVILLYIIQSFEISSNITSTTILVVSQFPWNISTRHWGSSQIWLHSWNHQPIFQFSEIPLNSQDYFKKHQERNLQRYPICQYKYNIYQSIPFTFCRPCVILPENTSLATDPWYPSRSIIFPWRLRVL